jgi:hypothetical protein
MSNGKRIYSGTYTGTALIGGVGLVNNLRLICTSQRIRIISIFLQMHFFIGGAPPIVWEKVNEESELLRWYLRIGSGIVGQNMTLPIINDTAIGFTSVENGEAFFIYKSGQWFFETFFVENVLNAGFVIVNYDALRDIESRASLIVETELL